MRSKLVTSVLIIPITYRPSLHSATRNFVGYNARMLESILKLELVESAIPSLVKRDNSRSIVAY